VSDIESDASPSLDTISDVKRGQNLKAEAEAENNYEKCTK